MKVGAVDFPKIQRSLLAAALMMVLGAAAARFSVDLSRAAQLARTAAAAERDAFEGKLRQARDEEIEIKRMATLLGKLQERGVIGEERRLDWVELLSDIRDKRRLIDLQYEISPRRPLDANAAKGFTFYASTMKLQLKLLHEEDLARLLDDLRTQAKALIQIRSCDVARLPHENPEQDGRALLRADCRIDWLTLHDVAAR